MKHHPKATTPATTRPESRPRSGLVRLAAALVAALCAALLLAGPAAAEPVEVPAQNFTGAETEAGSFGGGLRVAAYEATGELFVLDPEHDVVDRFHFDGTAWKKVGEIKGSETTAGSFNFGFNVYAGIAVDQATGDLYVTTFRLKVFAFKPQPSSPSGYEE